jgi:hypothetical protein
MEAPCDGWVPDTGVCPDWNTAGHTDATKAYAILTASYVIWAATGRRFGLCPTTVRPCQPVQAPLYLTYPAWSIWDTAVPGGGLPFGPYAQPGSCCTGSCQCSPSQIALPGGADSVTSVVIDGVVLDPSAYRLVGNLLVRQDGGVWPLQQDLASPLGDPNTWAITYAAGEAVPDVLQAAAGVYACELAKARTGGPCALPGRVQSISRGGVDIQYVDTTDYLDKGWTGVQEVDQIIATINPYGLKSRPRVLSLDTPSYY